MPQKVCGKEKKGVVSHLKGAEGQVKEYFIILGDGLTETHKDHVVDPKQRDEQQGGLG